MPASIKKYHVVFFLLIVSLIFGANWFYARDFSEFFFLSYYIESRSENIESVDVEFVDRTVILNVHVKNPTTCMKIITELGVNNVVVGNKVFEPACKSINKKLIKIVYAEIVSI